MSNIPRKNDIIINPKTNRPIKVGGRAWKNLVNEGVGLVGPNAAVNTPKGIFWMDKKGFYTYSGQVQSLPCSVQDYVFEDFSITNQTVLLVLIITVFFLFFQFIIHEDNSLYVIPSRFQVIIEMIFKLVTCIIINNIDLKNGQRFFPLICSIFLFYFIVSI